MNRFRNGGIFRRGAPKVVPDASAPLQPHLGQSASVAGGQQSAPVAGGQPPKKRGRGRPSRNAQQEVPSPSAPSSLNPGPSDPVIGAAQANSPDEDGTPLLNLYTPLLNHVHHQTPLLNHSVSFIMQVTKKSTVTVMMT